MARYGVLEYWILDPSAKTVELSRLTEIGYDQPIVVSEGRCASSVIAGFEIDLAAVFAEGVAI